MRPVSEGEAKLARWDYEDLPVVLNGVEWDADERSLYRLDAIKALAGTREFSGRMRDAANSEHDMSPAEIARLPDEIRAELGARVARLNDEYNAIKAEIDGGALITVKDMRRRYAACV